MLEPIVCLLLGAATGGALDDPPAARPAIGATVPDFSLKDIHRRPRSTADYRAARAIVVVFVGTECPLANLYFPTLVELHRAYAAQGVQFLAINSNDQDTFIEVSAHAQDRSIPFPVLKDFDQRVADAFGAQRTPEAILLDADRVIRYRGRIDDQYGIGYQRAEPRVTELKDAIDALLAGKAITKPESEVPGCYIGRARDGRSKDAVTYSAEVVRILQNRCQTCHRPGEIGPFPLLSYDNAREWSDTIREVVLEQRMPPWHPDPRFGKFSNERKLTDRERDTLIAWIDQGCAKGDESTLPPPREFPEGWTIGTPDVVYEMPVKFDVPAAGVVPYKRFVVDPNFTEDRWMQAAEARPGNRSVVHHILVYIQPPGKRIYDIDGTASVMSGWAPGDLPHVYPPGVAKRIPAGSKLVFEMHYTPNGTAQTDQSRVGIIFAKLPPDREAETNILANMMIKIPPGKNAHQGTLQYTFKRNARVLGFMPHMHLRGLSARYELTYPDGRTETLLSVPDYDFNWQSVYRFAEPLDVPQGSKLTWIGVWDNSADNPRNPDPTREVRWGEQTWDEMMNGWMDLVWVP